MKDETWPYRHSKSVNKAVVARKTGLSKQANVHKIYCHDLIVFEGVLLKIFSYEDASLGALFVFVTYITSR